MAGNVVLNCLPDLLACPSQSLPVSFLWDCSLLGDFGFVGICSFGFLVFSRFWGVSRLKRSGGEITVGGWDFGGKAEVSLSWALVATLRCRPIGLLFVIYLALVSSELSPQLTNILRKNKNKFGNYNMRL